MPDLLLNSLEIKGYRGFEHLTVDRLGRVNLVVGKNSVGKTALLEALYFYARPTRGSLAWISRSRKERSDAPEFLGPKIKTEDLEAFRYLFLERPVEKLNSATFQVSPVLSINPRLHPSFMARALLGFDLETSQPILAISDGVNELIDYDKSLDGLFRGDGMPLGSRPLPPCEFVGMDRLDMAAMAKLWEAITLTKFEDDLNNALRIVIPSLERINFTGSGIPIAKVDGLQGPFPLGSISEGANRMLGIVLALVNCPNGIVLIDEIEVGLHYSVLLDVWRLVFRTARELNVQVFVTTHSSDCILAFQRAAAENTQDEGLLIRLVQRNGQVRAIVFGGDELEIVAQDQIEVR